MCIDEDLNAAILYLNKYAKRIGMKSGEFNVIVKDYLILDLAAKNNIYKRSKKI